jgi:hypothetical protein
MIPQIREAIAEENRKDIFKRLWKGRQERGRPHRLHGFRAHVAQAARANI